MRLLAPLLALILEACSTAHYTVNDRLGHELATPYSRRHLLAGEAPDGIFMHAAFSGGGTRAAALAYGVLETLADTRLGPEAGGRALIDELAIISGVSGGALTAVAYAARRDDFFDAFACNYLYRDNWGNFVSRLVSPSTLYRMSSPRYGRSEALAEMLDAQLFLGRTFGDFARSGRRPMAIVSATSMYDGDRFEFTQERLDGLCSDLSTFPVSRAVAASMAVPGVLSPVVVWNHAPESSCLYRPEINSSPLYRVYERPFVHLLDGGLSDNLGVRNSIETIESFGGFPATMRAIGVRGVRRLVYLVVNAQNESEFDEAQSADVAGILRTLRAVADIPIERYSELSLRQLRTRLTAWAAEARAARDPEALAHVSSDVQLYFIEVSLHGVGEAGLRSRLLRLPTSLTLSPEEVDSVRQAARTLLMESAEFRRLLADLGATAPAPDLPRRAECPVVTGR